ncbi:anti-sigma factor [Methylocella sp.]|uniref:anti-sigma factor family protein n=1 Tax=Methylocella sp. TaxID=1978226 RepID=UPI0035AFC657
MTEHPVQISDAELMAFVDGECDAERRRTVEAYLAATPAAAERVEIWRQQGKALRAAFSRVEAEPAPASSILLPYRRREAQPASKPGAPAARAPGSGASARTRRAGRTSKRALVVAFAAGAACAVFVLLAIRGFEPAAPRAGAALGDEPLARRTLALLSAFAEAKAPGGAKPAREAERKPSPLIAPHIPGFEVVGVRASPNARGESSDDPFCVFYAHGAEAPAALCVSPDEGASSVGAVSADALVRVPSGRFGETAFVWRQAGGRYALAGQGSESLLRELASRMSAEIASLAR